MSQGTTGGVNANSGSVTAYPVAPLQPLSYEPFYEASEPRAIAVINGSNYQLVSFEIEKNAHGATDSAIIDLTLSNNPDWTVELFRDTNQNEPVYVEIWAGYPPVDTPPLTTTALNQRFIGILDIYTLEIDGDLGTFRCRSLAAPLVDTQITTLVQNMSSVDFVNYWAQSLGLTTVIGVVGTPVTLVQVYGDEFVTGIKNFRVWDVMLQMAQFDDVDVWVDGSTLYYTSPDLLTRNLVDLKYGRDLLGLSLTHSPQGNKNIRVEVRTYARRQSQSTTTRVQTASDGSVSVSTVSKVVTSQPVFGTLNRVSATTGPNGQSVTTTVATGGSFSSGFTSPGSESGLERYVRFYPNLSPAQCNALAQALWRQISRLEYAVSIHLPMTEAKMLALSDMTALIRLHGTPYFLAESSNSSAVNDYYPRRTTEEFNEQGWLVTIEAVNHSISSQGV